jgi:chemotaxis family two-component system response regulator Rcp1
MTTLAERGKSPEVLVIDDSRGDAMLVRIAFKTAQTLANITIAPSAEAGLDALRREGAYEHYGRPDLILLDLNLPRMHGLTFLNLVKNDPEHRSIPVIVLSSSAAEKDVTASYADHANGYITKPRTLDEYGSLVTNIGNYWFRDVHTPAGLRG